MKVEGGGYGNDRQRLMKKKREADFPLLSHPARRSLATLPENFSAVLTYSAVC